MEVKLKGITQVQILKVETAYQILKRVLKRTDKLDQSKENLWVIGLKASNHIDYIDLVSLGTLKSTMVEPREVFRRAVHKAVDKIIIAHNHPSGSLKPSAADKSITLKIQSAGKVIGIEMVDHLIITKKGFFSFANEGQL